MALNASLMNPFVPEYVDSEASFADVRDFDLGNPYFLTDSLVYASCHFQPDIGMSELFGFYMTVTKF